MTFQKYITPPVNANAIQGVPVSDASPADGQVLRYNEETGLWEPAEDLTGGGGPGGGADPGAQFIVLSATGSLANERVLTAGSGITLTDGGAGGAATIGFDDRVIAGTSGSTFTQLSGSLQRLASGITYLAGVGGITITTASNGQVLISGSFPDGVGSSGDTGADRDVAYLTIGFATSSLPNERIIATGTGIVGTDNGAGNSFSLAVDPAVVAFVTASKGLSASFVTLGTSVAPASSSLIRVGNAAGSIMAMRNNGNSADHIVFANTATEFFIGSDTSFGNQVGTTRTYASSGNYFGIGSTTIFGCESTGFFSNANTGLGTNAPSFGGGSKVTYQHVATTAPTSNPTNGVILYVDPTTILPMLRTVSGVYSMTALSGTGDLTVPRNVHMSGVYQQQTPTLAPKVRTWQHVSQSVTTGSVATPMFTFTIPSGAMSVDVLATATQANVGSAGTFRKMTLFRNAVGSVTQEGIAGGTDCGSLATSGSAWGISIDNSTTTGRLVLTGSAATTITWAWTVNVTEVSP